MAVRPSAYDVGMEPLPPEGGLDRAFAVRDLCREARSETVPLLKACLEEEIRRQDVGRTRQPAYSIVILEHVPLLLKTLHDLGVPPDRETLNALLQSPTHDVVTGALEYIHERERREFMPEVEQALKHRGEHARVEAMRTFIDLGGPDEALDQALRAMKSPLSPTSARIWETLADRGVVDLIEVLESYKSLNPGIRRYIPEIVKLLGVGRVHALFPPEEVVRRLLALEEELRRGDPQLQTVRMCYDDRWLWVLKGLGEAGARDLAGDLALRLVRAPDAWRWTNLAEAFPDPAWLPKVAADAKSPATLALRARCGDPESRTQFLDAAERHPSHPEVWRPKNAALLPPDRRAALWRSAFQSAASPSDRRTIIGFAPGGFGEILRAIEEDPKEHPLVRADARRVRALPPPDAPPRLVRFAPPQLEKLRKKWRKP